MTGEMMIRADGGQVREVVPRPPVTIERTERTDVVNVQHFHRSAVDASAISSDGASTLDSPVPTVVDLPALALPGAVASRRAVDARPRTGVGELLATSRTDRHHLSGVVTALLRAVFGALIGRVLEVPPAAGAGRERMLRVVAGTTWRFRSASWVAVLLRGAALHHEMRAAGRAGPVLLTECSTTGHRAEPLRPIRSVSERLLAVVAGAVHASYYITKEVT